MQKLHTQKQPLKYFTIAILLFTGAALLITSFLKTTTTSLLYCHGSSAAQAQTEAILHYATTHVVPQQSIGEITVSFEVLKSIGPSNFLVFGLGHDSLMWASINPHGKTLFLEEDPAWVQTVLKDAPTLRADTVKYRTRLDEADGLLNHFLSEPDCSPANSFLRGNDKCRLALNMLSNEVYDTEWDMIMLDAPRGYSAELPGRMSVIYSAAVMAKNRKKAGVTHVFLHDIDRRVERLYAERFLCKKYLAHHVGRLWHFEIPPSNITTAHEFC